MKGNLKKAMLVLAGVLLMFAGGCVVDGSDLDGPSVGGGGCGGGCCDSGCYSGPTDEWYALTYIWTLEVGAGCGGGCGYECCPYSDVDWAIDTLEFTSFDEELVDLQLNFTLTNWSYYTTPVWVSLCDDLGCETVLAFDLFPGEVYSDQVNSAILDTALSDLSDCFFLYGDFCSMTYDVEIDLGQDCVCSPVTLDYFYNGYYVYY